MIFIIDHKVIVGGLDVSNEVIEISVQQSIETDSDPGKISIKLANRAQKYTNRFPPQLTPIEITLYNYTYKNEPKEFLVATGHMTDLKANHDEAIVTGECDLGHLADALPKDYDKFNVTPKEALEEILSWHTDQVITLDWDPALDNTPKERITYNSDNTYQDVCEDIRQLIGAVYYFSEANILCFRSPWTTKGFYDLDPYVTNPDQTASIMGFRNWVVVVGDQSLVEPKDGLGAETPGVEPIISEYPHGVDLDSVGEVGPLLAPTEYAYNLKTQDEVNARADQLVQFSKMYKNAETTVEVTGMVPPLQSIVSYSPFIPISDAELQKSNDVLATRLKEMQDLENKLAAEQDRTPVKLTLSRRIQGVVVAKDVKYSISSLDVTLTISPGLLDGNPITADDISGSTWNPAGDSGVV